MHHLFREVQQRDCSLVGVDLNSDVVQTCRDVAQKLNASGLDFQVGEIGNFAWEAPVDVVVSLHACDTATDDVLAAAALHQVPVILSAPCCQHELAPQLANPEWHAFLQHGILRERLGALATDALRAAALETLGYEIQLMEFVDLEHTPKNLLIRAVLSPTSLQNRETKLTHYHSLRKTLGIKSFHLENHLNRWLES